MLSHAVVWLFFLPAVCTHRLVRFPLEVRQKCGEPQGMTPVSLLVRTRLLVVVTVRQKQSLDESPVATLTIDRWLANVPRPSTESR